MHRQNNMNGLQDVLGPNVSSFQLVDDQLAGVFAQSRQQRLTIYLD